MRYGLRIKQRYFDQVLSGEKTFELRDYSPRYKNLLKAKEVLLHYQRERKLVADVIAVSVIDTPIEVKRANVGIGAKCYRVDLANPRLIAGTDFDALPKLDVKGG